MRTVWEYNVWIETSIGRVEGVLWSNGELGLTSPLVAEAEREDVSTWSDIAETLVAVGVPADEARRVARTVLDDALGTFPERFAKRFVKPS